MAGWVPGPGPVCHADLTGHRGPAAGLGSGVSGNPGGIGARVVGKDSSSLPARLGDCQPVRRGEGMRAISQCLLPQVKVAVRAAKQDARNVHFRLDRARSSVHTEISPAGLRA
jgi:hypothetical protein